MIMRHNNVKCVTIFPKLELLRPRPKISTHAKSISIKLSNPHLVYYPTRGCLVSEIDVMNLVCAITFVRLVYICCRRN